MAIPRSSRSPVATHILRLAAVVSVCWRLWHSALGPAWTPATKHLRSPLVARKAGEESKDATWRAAYNLELERYELLREQLQSQGLKQLLLAPELPDTSGEPEACLIDWEGEYESLVACTRALEQQLKEQAEPAFLDRRDVEAAGPAMIKVPLAGQGTDETIELSRFFGKSSAFYEVKAKLPLGLNFTKRTSGVVMGGFVVEDVLPGGSAEASGRILEGDVLQALTVVNDNADLGMKVEDFVSSVVGGFGRFRQALADASFIDTAEDLVDAMQSNTILGSDTQLTLVFERDTSSSPAPEKPLVPEKAL